MFKRSKPTLLFLPGLVLVILAFSASPALATSPWWHLISGSRPTDLPAKPGEEGEIVLTAENMGDADVSGETSPVRIVDTLPSGLKAVGITAQQPAPGDTSLTGAETLLSCKLKTLTCESTSALVSYDQIEVRIKVEVEQGAKSGETNEAAISGGGAPPATVSHPIALSGKPTPFGVEEYGLSAEEAGGAPATQAGWHPYQVTGVVDLNQDADADPLGKGADVDPAALAKDIVSKLPPGLIGNPTPFPQCTLGQFLTIANGREDGCTPQTAVGVASVTVTEPAALKTYTYTQPIFNLQPGYGEPARFAFMVVSAAGDVPVTLDASLRGGPGTGEEYAINVGSTNISQLAGLLSARVTFWGTPASSLHDNSRGWGCIYATREVSASERASCVSSEEPHPPAFLTMPTSCAGPLQSSVETDSWAAAGDFETAPTSEPLQSLDGCNQLPFKPTIQAEPSTDRASAPSGLDFNLNFDDEGLTSSEGVAQSQLNKTVVTLPEGFTINPSAGVGLGGCTSADYANETLESAPGAGCPNDSKLGTVEIQTPLLSTPVHGSLFIAQPYENQFDSLVALYVVAKNPETGILIKLAGKVTPNPVTGQLTTTFEDNPQLAFDHFNFHFREGQQAPLISPPACGTYTTQAALTPWSEPAETVTDTSSFTITEGYEGGACPSGGLPPFRPQIQAGLLNNNAGAFSELYVHLSRSDGEQQISGFSTNLPPGLTGDLTGIPFCPEADIALARTKSGAEEEASPSCPAASEIGHTLVGTGVGAVLAYVPGKIYLAGPFDGAPFSIVSVTSAVVGPFDLGTVVLRFGLNINPYTAQVSVSPTSSEPIPTIIDGIVTHVRDIRVYINRSGFTLNPTSCDAMAISSTLTSSQGASATVSSPFQSASCQTLKFAPKFSASTSGRTSKANGASLSVKLTYPTGALGQDANIAKVKVDLPKQLPSRLTTLQKACTAKQFNANPAGCPAASVIGHAKAVTPLIPVPLEGPAYFVSHGGEAFPSLIMVLQGYGVTIDLVGSTFISHAGITSSTFKAVPDQPVTSFELTLPEGKYSALAANGNLCTSKLAMPTAFVGQNGAEIHDSTAIGVTGCAKAKALTRAQKLAKALKACKEKAKSKRAGCRAKARKQFGPLKKAKKGK